MKMRFSTFLYLTIRIVGMAILLAPTSLLSPRYPAMAQTTDTDWVLQFDGTTDNVLLTKTADIIGSGWETTKSVNLWVKPMKPPGENDCDNPDPPSCDTIFGDKPRWWGITIGRLPWGHHATQDRIWIWNEDDNLDFIGIPYTVNEWVNIALVHEGGVLRAYKNGVLAGSVISGATYQVPGSGSDLYLGGTTTGPESIRIFGGQIDEVHIWNVALSAAEIIDQMYQATITDTLGLKAYYQMSNGEGTILTDDSQFNWTGTLLDGTPPGIPGNGTYPLWIEHDGFSSPPVPAAPTDLSIVEASFYRVDLTWIDNSEDEFSFEIERCSGVGCSDFSLLETILDSPGTGLVNYEDTQVSTGTFYCYRVRAANTGGESDYSNVDCAAVPIPVYLPMVMRR